MKVLGLTLVLCCLAGVSCLRKRISEKALPRAVVSKDFQGTCQRLLPPAEFKNLLSQLTPADPLVVVSTNDIHGHTDERTFNLKVSDSQQQTVTVGGFSRLAAYLTAMCRESKGRLLYLDSGDSYQGTALSNSSAGLAVVESFSALGLVASTFGNHEFDFGQDQIKGWLASPKRNFWYVTSSVAAVSNGKSVPWSELNAPNFARSVVLDIAGVRVGIAGYTTDSTPAKSIPDNVQNLSFGQLEEVFLNEAEPLRRQGAQVTILLSHAGGSCDMRQPPETGNRACEDTPSDELGRFLRNSKDVSGRWSLVLAGHTHRPQAHWIGGVPVVQTSGLGLSLTHSRISISPKGVTTEIKRPVYLCQSHFENWNGCHPEEWQSKTAQISSLGAPVAPKFGGRVVNITDGARLDAVLEPWRAELKKLMSKSVSRIPVELPHDRTAQSPAAACLADAWLNSIRKSDEHWGEYQAKDVEGVFLNAGALRSGLPSGDLLWGKLFEIIPYDNTAHIAAVSETELTAFARAHESSPHDYLLASEGWTVLRADNGQPAPRTIEVRRAQSNSDPQKKWVIAVTTFSKSFFERAGLKVNVYDSGLSVRESIASALSTRLSELKSCQSPDTQRMKIQ